jgi:hypothetical protein
MRARISALLVIMAGAIAVAGQPQSSSAQTTPPPQIRGIEPSRIIAGQNFNITVVLPARYSSGIRLAVRRLSHQAAAKYESPVIYDNNPPGDINPEVGVIEHVVPTNEGWLPLAAVQKLDASSERYAVGLDSGFAEMNVVTVTGGADVAGRASIIDGNLDTFAKAVKEWLAFKNAAAVGNLKVVEIDEANPSVPNDQSKFLAWGEVGAGRSGASGGAVRHFVLEHPPDAQRLGDLTESQKGSLMMSARELEKALALLPKESAGKRAAEVQQLRDALSDSAKSSATK